MSPEDGPDRQTGDQPAAAASDRAEEPRTASVEATGGAADAQRDAAAYVPAYALAGTPAPAPILEPASVAQRTTPLLTLSQVRDELVAWVKTLFSAAVYATHDAEEALGLADGTGAR